METRFRGDRKATAPAVALVLLLTSTMPFGADAGSPAAGDCLLVPDDAGTGEDAGPTEDRATPVAVDVGARASGACFHEADLDDWYRLSSVPGAGYIVEVATKAPTWATTPILTLTDCAGTEFAEARTTSEGYEIVTISFTPAYPALCVGASLPLSFEWPGASVPYEIRLTLWQAACVDDDGGSGRDATFRRPVELGLDVYTGSTSVSGCFPGTPGREAEAQGRDDHYTFAAEAARPFRIGIQSLDCSSPHFFAVYGPGEGTSWASKYLGGVNSAQGCGPRGTGFVPAETGRHRVLVYSRSGAYELTFSPPLSTCGVQNDAASHRDAGADPGTALPAASGETHSACIDDVDKADLFALPVAAGDRIQGWVARVPEPDGTLRPLQSELLDDRGRRVSWGSLSGASPLSADFTAVAPRAGTWHLKVSNQGVGTNYTFSWSSAATGTPVIPPEGEVRSWGRGPLVTCAGTVYRADGWGMLFTVDPAGQRIVRASLLDSGGSPVNALLCEAGGTLLFDHFRVEGALTIRTLHELPPPLPTSKAQAIVPATLPLAGPSGRVYDVADGALHEIHCTSRTRTTVQPLPSGFTFGFAPDGTLYGVNRTGVHAIDGAGIPILVAPVPLSFRPRNVAFDMAGHAYFSAYRDNVIHRANLTTGAVEPLLGDAEGEVTLTFQGSRLWAFVESLSGADARYQYYDLGVPGFEGHEVECDVGYGDLAPTITGTSRTTGTAYGLAPVENGRLEVHGEVANLGVRALEGGYTVSLYARSACDPGIACPLILTTLLDRVTVTEELPVGATRSFTLGVNTATRLPAPTTLVVRTEPLEGGDGNPENDEDTVQYTPLMPFTP